MISVSSVSANAAMTSCEGLFQPSPTELLSAEYGDIVFDSRLTRGLENYRGIDGYGSEGRVMTGNLIDVLVDISETAILFPNLGQSVARVFSKHGAHYAPLNSLMGDKRHSTSVPKIDLIRKLFASGYLLSKGSQKYSDTGDMVQLMMSGESRPLEAAVMSSEANRKFIRKHFTVTDGSRVDYGPLMTDAPGETYFLVVSRKLRLLNDIGVDLSSVLENVTTSAWVGAGSKERVLVAKYLIETLGVKSAVNHSWRAHDGDKSASSPLFFAIASGDQALVNVYMRNGANADVLVPRLAGEWEIKHYGLKPGETLREFAARKGIKLNP